MLIKLLIIGIGIWFNLHLLYAQETFNRQKVSSYLRKIILNNPVSPTRNLSTENKYISALIKFRPSIDIDAIEEKYQCRLLDRINQIYIMQIPVTELAQLSMDEQVLRIESQEIPRLTMNDTPTRLNVDKIWSGQGLSMPFTGKGVVSGIVDIGFDFLHPMFLDNDGNTRVLRYYDVNKKKQNGIYAVYDTDDITEIKHSLEAVNQSHGTHVASLMAGSQVKGEKSIYSGIAYGSNIVVSEVSLTSADLIYAFSKLYHYADSIRQPCVINFSASAPSFLTESYTLANEAIDGLLGPGHILVSGAGNEGGLYPTLEKPAEMPKVIAKFSKAAEINYGSDYVFSCDLVTQNPATMLFGYHTKMDTYSDSLYLSTDTLDLTPKEAIKKECSRFKIKAQKIASSKYFKGSNIYHIEIETNEAYLEPLFSVLNLEIVVTSNSECLLHVYPPMTFMEANNTGFTADMQNCMLPKYTIGWPGEIENVICVGSASTKYLTYYGEYRFYDSPILSKFSSRGPTWDDRIKPDVLAPGDNIFGAYNQYNNSLSSDKGTIVDKIIHGNGNNSYIAGLSGTSMSSPIVAGIIALWLQAKPDLTPEEIKEVIAKTSSPLDDGKNYPNYDCGYGMIDAYAGLLDVLNLPSSISELSTHQPIDVMFSLDGRMLIIKQKNSSTLYEGKIEINIYTIDGRKVASSNMPSIDLTTLANGTYAVQLNTETKECSGSTLIRL